MPRATNTTNPTTIHSSPSPSPSPSPAKRKQQMERKVMEKNRRNHMKNLCSNLTSLLPRSLSKGRMTLPDKLDDAAKYIQRLEEQLKEARERKNELVSVRRKRAKRHTSCTETSSSSGLKTPKMEIHEMGSALEVVLVTNLDHQFMMYEVIRILHNETVEVLHASLSVVGNTIFHTVHAQIEESMFCFRAATIKEKLKKLVGFGLACDEEEFREGQQQEEEEEEEWWWDDQIHFENWNSIFQ